MRHSWQVGGVVAALTVLVAASPLVSLGSASGSASLGKSTHGPATRITARVRTAQHVARFDADAVLFGDSAVGSGHKRTPSGTAQAARISAERSGLVAAVSIYLDSGTTARTVEAGLYDDRGARPGRLLARAVILAPTAGAWNTSRIRPVSVRAGQRYWLAVLGQGGRVDLRTRPRRGCASTASRHLRLRGLLHARPLTRTRFDGCMITAVATGTATATPLTYSNVPFADSFESGSLSAWTQTMGTGTPAVTTTAAHSGLYGVRLANSRGQYQVVVKALSSAAVDSLTTFWVRLNSPSGQETVAEGRDKSSNHEIWWLTYDSAQQGFVFYPYRGSTSTEIFTGAGSAPINTWLQVQLRYTATSTGGAQIYINGRTQPGWSVSGNYVRNNNLQRIQLWNSAATSTDFDDVSFGTPGAMTTDPPANAGLPVISGQTVQGQTVTTSNGSWSGSPNGYSYAWQQCDSAGANCTSIGGMSSSSYTLASGDLGHTIRSVVTAINSGGSTSASSAQTAPVTAPPPAAEGLHAVGNTLQDANGNVVRLHGVNYSGPEYACVQGWGIFDGPSDAASVQAMASWHVNAVRIPLNEDCWLGINGVPAADAGQNYINAIVNYVKLVHSYGMYAELSLIWGAPGTAQATYQPTGPDADHSPAMWASLASTFKNDPNVILAPWGETTVSWSCYISGCNNEDTYGSNQDGLSSCGSGCWYYKGAGLQQAVNVIRQAGYNGVISIPCIAYANVCQTVQGSEWGGSTWLKSRPTDTLSPGQIVAEAHVYGKNVCDTTSCFNENYLPILQAGYPMIWGETGETYDDSSCGSTNTSTFMTWADTNGVGYQAWTWDTWGTCGSLIKDFSGTPANAYGTWVRSHYQALP